MQNSISVPCSVHQVPNLIPYQPWYLKSKYLYIFTGIVPFTSIVVELFYLMGSLWRHYYYSLFGFLLISLVLYVLLSALVSIIITHHMLNKGNYHWWWRSILISGSGVIYFALFSIYYFFSLKIIGLSSSIIYFSTMWLIGVIMFSMCASFGFLFTFYYIRKIYSSIKID